MSSQRLDVQKCNKPNHFARMCMTPMSQCKPEQPQRSQKPKLHQVTATKDDSLSRSDNGYLYSTGKDRSKIPSVNVKINNTDVEMIIDTGASTDIIDEPTFEKVNQGKNLTLQSTTKRLFAYVSEEQLPVLGKFKCSLAFRDVQQNARLHVIEGNHGSLNLHVSNVISPYKISS